MKKIKAYLVFVDVPDIDIIKVYYIGKSRRSAKQEFIDRALKFFSNVHMDTTSLRFITVELDKADYEFLLDFDSSDFGVIYAILSSNYCTEIGRINNDTFSKDFLPYYIRKAWLSLMSTNVYEHLHPSILTSTKGAKARYWLIKYLKSNF